MNTAVSIEPMQSITASLDENVLAEYDISTALHFLRSLDKGARHKDLRECHKITRSTTYG